jgi:hypothetical protein
MELMSEAVSHDPAAIDDYPPVPLCWRELLKIFDARWH